MPYKVKGKCIYKKDTGKKVGCTTGPVKKYLAALNINAHEAKVPTTITQKDTLKSVRKPMPPPSRPFKNKTDYNRKVFKSFKEYIINTLQGQNVVDNQNDTSEAYAADGQDETIPSSQPLADSDIKNKSELVVDVINDLEDLKINYNWSTPLNDDLIKAMANTLRDAGIEPTDFDASVGATPEQQEQYLIYGPSSWKGGKGALNDLKAILAGKEPQVVDEEESVPASDLPMGSTSAGDSGSMVESTYRIGEVILDNPYGTGRKHFQGIDRIEAISENDALNKFIRRLAVSKKIPTSPEILYRNAQKNNVSIVKIEDKTSKTPKYWWQDKDDTLEEGYNVAHFYLKDGKL